MVIILKAKTRIPNVIYSVEAIKLLKKKCMEKNWKERY